MRIIAGEHRGRILKSPQGGRARPTLGRVREALFNILSPRLSRCDFLDLYAGVGGIGLEALSRGSRRVVLVEGDHQTGKILAGNVQRLDPPGRRTEIILADALATARRLARRGDVFHFIFSDPPYLESEIAKWTRGGDLAALLRPQGTLILQHAKRMAVPDIWAGCRKYRERTYGITALSFFKAPDAGNTEQTERLAP